MQLILYQNFPKSSDTAVITRSVQSDPEEEIRCVFDDN